MSEIIAASAPTDLEELLRAITDPVERMILSGEAATVFEAEEKFLDAAHPEVLKLLASPLSDDELANHPLLQLFRSYGSPGREDSLA